MHMFYMPQTYTDDTEASYFDSWLSSGVDIWSSGIDISSYDIVEYNPEHEEWVDVRSPLPTLDCVHHVHWK